MEMFLQVALVVAALVYVIRPLWRAGEETAEPADGSSASRSYWERRKHEALATIKEAEFDLGMGKMSREDFDRIREKYLDIAARAQSEVESLGEARHALGGRAWSSARLCTNCGVRQRPNARFCAQCGSPLGGSPLGVADRSGSVSV